MGMLVLYINPPMAKREGQKKREAMVVARFITLGLDRANSPPLPTLNENPSENHFWHGVLYLSEVPLVAHIEK